MASIQKFEVIIIGGSYAGLSAALALGRSLREVLILDAGKRCNRQTPHAHNFLTQDGERPDVIAEKARLEVSKYSTIKLVNDAAISGKQIKDGFLLTTETGLEFIAKKLIFATGIKDLMPDIKGFSACWGISVIHCPYCHGYEFRNQKTAIMANGPRAFHLASLINNLTDDISILSNGPVDFSSEEIFKLKAHQIKIITEEVVEMVHENGQIKQVVFRDGSTQHFDALYAGIPFEQNSGIPVQLGCELTEQGYLKVDGFQESNVKGIFACGDNTAMLRSIANAVYGGNLTGAMVNKKLTEEAF